MSLVILLGGCGDLEEELSSLTILPSSATTGINQIQLFRVIGKNSVDQIVSVAPQWSITGGIGSITPDSYDSSYAILTAGSQSGEGSVVATYGVKSASASVAVTNNGWLTGVIRTPELDYAQGIIVYLEEISSLRDDTNSNGEYLIANIPSGTYEARTEETGLYLSASSEVTIRRGETVTWTTTLSYRPGIPTVPTTTLFTP